MKKLICTFYFLIIGFASIFAQYLAQDQEELNTLKKLPLENVYVHANSVLFFPGEYLYYSVYCTNSLTNKFSNISRIAYIELVGEDLQPVFKQKVVLNQGRGQGDFFIPASVSSGNYKLIGYTNWMKNAGLNQFFLDDVVIVNPYLADQQSLLVEVKKHKVDSFLNRIQKGAVLKNNDKSISITTEKDVFGKREKVSFIPRNYKGPLGYGDYSISVRRKSEIKTKPRMSASNYGAFYLTKDKVIPNSLSDSIFLPEQRGELFYGEVLNDNKQPVKDETIILSIPGENFQLKSAITNQSGYFYTYVNKAYETPVLVAQTTDDFSSLYQINLKSKTALNYERITFNNFKLMKSLEDEILNRSVYNQIENSYYSVKPDSIIFNALKDPFDGGIPTVIVLDEYTRFPTVRETLVEVVDNVWVKKLNNGEYTFWVREKLEDYESDYESDPPIVLIDGIFVPDHSSILDFDARLIEKISILRDPLVLGDKKYLGMVVMETFEGDYLNRIPQNTLGKKELLLPTPNKNYFNQSYAGKNSEKYASIPDYRSQLYWNPSILINQDSNTVSYEFYTSDYIGDYEIVLEGFTTYGKPISVVKTITVK